MICLLCSGRQDTSAGVPNWGGAQRGASINKGGDIL